MCFFHTFFLLLLLSFLHFLLCQGKKLFYYPSFNINQNILHVASRTKLDRLEEDAADLDDLQNQLGRMDGLSNKLVTIK